MRRFWSYWLLESKSCSAFNPRNASFCTALNPPSVGVLVADFTFLRPLADANCRSLRLRSRRWYDGILTLRMQCCCSFTRRWYNGILTLRLQRCCSFTSGWPFNSVLFCLLLLCLSVSFSGPPRRVVTGAGRSSRCAATRKTRPKMARSVCRRTVPTGRATAATSSSCGRRRTRVPAVPRTTTRNSRKCASTANNESSKDQRSEEPDASILDEKHFNP